MSNPKNKKLNFKYEYDEKSKILYKYYYGDISLKDITTSWKHALDNKLIPQENKGFILDYREASYSLGEGEYKDIPKFFKQYSKVFKKNKIAVISENPLDITIPILVNQEDEDCHAKPFSTQKAAESWVLTGEE